jgi:hypothetical protein
MKNLKYSKEATLVSTNPTAYIKNAKKRGDLRKMRR